MTDFPRLPHDPDFGVDPKDSAQLLELRDAIDSYLGWKSTEDEEHGDYVFRIREIGDMLWNCKAAFIEHRDAELMAKIMLSVTKMADEKLRQHPTINHKFDLAANAAREHRCSCMELVHGHVGGVCQAMGGVWHKEEGWPDALMLCPMCIKHPANAEIESLRSQLKKTQDLSAKCKRQRRELKRLHRDEHLRSEERRRERARTEAIPNPDQVGTVQSALDLLRVTDKSLFTERTRASLEEKLEAWFMALTEPVAPESK